MSAKMAPPTLAHFNKWLIPTSVKVVGPYLPIFWVRCLMITPIKHPNGGILLYGHNIKE